MLEWRRIPPSALIGLVLTLGMVLVALLAPWIAPYENGQVIGDVWAPMSDKAWLGTDNLGRDLLTRMIYGARVTLTIAGASTALSFTVGATLGLMAAVAGGWLASQPAGLKLALCRSTTTLCWLPRVRARE